MSNFAERLVARGAGWSAVPGVSLLTSRPAYRFEPGPVVEFTHETVMQPPASVAPHLPAADAPAAPDIAALAPAEPPAAGRRQDQVSERQQPQRKGRPDDGGEPRTLPAPANESSIPVDEAVERRSIADTRLIENSEARGGDSVPQPAVERLWNTVEQRIESGRNSAEHAEQVPEPAQERDEFRTVMKVEEAVQPTPPETARRDDAGTPKPPAQGGAEVMARDDVSVAESPAPASVTIGRIDVQFVPQDLPKPAPPPRAERSRGFETYARARRGQPR